MKHGNKLDLQIKQKHASQTTKSKVTRKTLYDKHSFLLCGLFTDIYECHLSSVSWKSVKRTELILKELEIVQKNLLED